MEKEEPLTEIHRIRMENIPITMENTRDLKEFCSRFGKVISITRSTSDKTCAVIEFGDTHFLDQNFYKHFQSIPFVAVHDHNKFFQNGQFLSNVLNSYNTSTANTTDGNRNMIDDLFDEGYLICTYCYCCAELRCERCNAPYCSEKCQHLDWLTHKKICSLQKQTHTKRTVKQGQ